MRTRMGLTGILVSAFALSISSAFAQPRPIFDGRPPQAKAEIQYVSKQPLGKGITLARISNGMTVIVQENHAAPVATVRCYIHNTGSVYEGKDLGAGLSHVLEHLLAGGTTTKRTETQIREILDSLGGQTNAYTSEEVTCFLTDCPAAEVAVAIELVAQNMQHSVIPESEYKRELGVVQRELEMGEADRQRVLYSAMKQLIYTEHPQKHPIIGYLPVVQQITRQDVINFYKDRYVPQNMTFVVVGDVNTDSVLADVLAGFKTFQRTTERVVTLPVEPEQASPRSNRIEMEGPTVHYSVAWPTVALQHADLYPLDVASYVLSNGDSSRLTRRLKIEKPLAISVTSASYTPGHVKGWFQVTVQCPPQNLDAVKKIVAEEIERLQKEPVQPAELAKVKRQKAADHVFSQQKVENQAESLASSYRSTGDPLFDTHYVAGIQKVTADEIVAAAKKYFRADRLNTLTIEPLGSAKEAAEKSTSDVESPISKQQLPNGLTVLLKRQAAVPLVTIQAYVKAGAVSDTTATAGLASLATEMLEHGTKKYSADQIAEFFDSIGGSLALNSQTNTSYLQCSVLKDDADAALDYVHQVLFEPTFPAEEFANVKQIRLGRISGRAANPQTEIMDFLAKQFPADSPYSHTALGTAEMVSKLTRDDCVKFHKTYFVPNNMVLAIFGDIDVEAMRAKIAASFGKVPKSDSFQWPNFPVQQSLLAVDKTEHLTNQKKNTAMVAIAFPSVSVRDESNRAALDMLDAILVGGGGAGGRLHEELRGAQLVYYVFGMQMTGFAPGYFVFLAQSRPESKGEVVSRIRANLDKIAKEGIPADEFQKAREKLIAAHAMQGTTAAEKAFQSAIDELYGLGYDYEKSFVQRINKVKPEDVTALVKKHFTHGIVTTSSPE